MARVHLSGELRRLGGGAPVQEVEAATVGELIEILSEIHPDLGIRLREGMAVALDGEVMSNADYQPLTSDTDVHFVPPISGG